MLQSIKNTRLPFPAALIQIGLLITCFIYLYAHTLAKLISDWNTDDNFSHGFLIPLISGYMIWGKKKELAGTVIQPNRWGLVIICFAMAMHIAGNIGAELFVMRSSMVLCLMGLALYLFGRRITALVFVPLVYLFFMIPIPAIIWNQIAFPLQLLAAKLSVRMIQLLGITVLREGNILQLSNTTLEVVNACSGIRSLTTLLALSAAFAYLSRLKLFGQWVLFLSAVPIAIFVNVIRLTVTSVLASTYGPEFADGFIHELSGVVVFGVALIALYGVYIVLSRVEKRMGVNQ
jgi:exosortase